MSIQNIKAFNEGYQLAKLNHELSEKLAASVNENSSEKMKYFKEGVTHCTKEIQKEIQKQKYPVKNKEIDKEK